MLLCTQHTARGAAHLTCATWPGAARLDLAQCPAKSGLDESSALHRAAVRIQSRYRGYAVRKVRCLLPAQVGTDHPNIQVDFKGVRHPMSTEHKVRTALHANTQLTAAPLASLGLVLENLLVQATCSSHVNTASAQAACLFCFFISG